MDKSFENRYVKVTDDEFLRVCSDVAATWCKERRKYGPLDERACRAKADDAFKTAYRNALGYKRNDALKAEHLLEMNEIYMSLQSRIYDAVREIIRTYASKEKALAIRKASGDATVRAGLSAAGFVTLRTECQCYRVKATVRIKRYAATIAVKYKDILEGRLDGYIEDFKETLLKLESAPYEVRICK